MPIFDGFTFSSEEPHHNFTLSQETLSLPLKRSVPEKQYI